MAARKAKKRPIGRPRKDAVAAEGVALVAGGMVLEDAARRLAAEGKSISARTLRRAAAKAPPLPPPRPPTPAPARPPSSDPAEPTDLDPLATLARVQKGLELDLVWLPVEQVVQRRAIAGLLIQVAKAAEIIRLGRPEETDDEERYQADRDAVLRRIREKLPELLAARLVAPAQPAPAAAGPG